ncbi:MULTISPECIES: TniB family NTP-binding protein [Psychrobacter]|uniref:TniB family NTP-binding protein n=1 Tax=Psychrobacter TaxID=497 RepID=UPI000EE2B0D7|nr:MULTISPECIES: TniB family NTP-binding protein [Psychrobacter]HCR88428.1 transposase [Psychrobacter sp.]
MNKNITNNKASYLHVYKDFRHLVEYSDDDRLDFINEARWVNYEVADNIILELNGLLRFPKRLRMPNLLIVGDSNNGKTSIAHRFFRKHGMPVEENGILVKPVIFANAPSSTNEKDLYMSILEALHMPYRTKDSASSLLYQVLHLCREYQVKMIMVDELHSLLTGTPRQQRQVMNALKTLCNELQIPIVGIGTQDAKRVLHTDPQHASRFDIVEVPLWKLDKKFQELLFRLESVFPLKNSSELHQPKTAALIHAVSRGNLGNIHRLLSVCAKDAILSGTEQITEDILTKNKDVRPTEGLR